MKVLVCRRRCLKSCIKQVGRRFSRLTIPEAFDEAHASKRFSITLQGLIALEAELATGLCYSYNENHNQMCFLF